MPGTVSAQARAFLAEATPFDLGKPDTVEEWAALRESIQQSFGDLASLRGRFDFTLEEKRFGGVPADLFSVGGAMAGRSPT